MPIKSLKPITPGQRGRTVNGFDAITTDKPEKSLLVPLKKSGGRNSQGKMTMKFRGGCLLYTSPSPRDGLLSRMPSSA